MKFADPVDSFLSQLLQSLIYWWKTLNTIQAVITFRFVEGDIPAEEHREDVSEMNESSCEIWRKPAALQKHEESVSPWASINDSLATC